MNPSTISIQPMLSGATIAQVESQITECRQRERKARLALAMARGAIEAHQGLYKNATEIPSLPGTNDFFEQLTVLEEHRKRTQNAKDQASRCRQEGQLLNMLELKRNLLLCEENYHQKQHAVELERINLHLEKDWSRTIINKFRSHWRYFSARIEAGESRFEANREAVERAIEGGIVFHTNVIYGLEVSVKVFEEASKECRERLKELRRAWFEREREYVEFV